MYVNLSIAVIIPCFNEERQIAGVLKAIPEFVDWIIVVDDGSEDDTENISLREGAIVVKHNRNRGVGAAFKSGLNKAIDLDADIMVNIDADGQFNPADITKLITPISNGEYEVVTASRFINKDYYPKMSKIKFLGNKFMSWFISKLTDNKFYDVSCGFRAYSRKAMIQLNLFGDFTYTQETFIDLSLKSIMIKEIPIHVLGKREHGKSRVASNLFRYGYQTLKIIIKTLRDHKPLKLFGFFALIMFLLGLGFGIFLMHYYIINGSFSPNKWAGLLSLFSIALSIVLLFVGFIMDSISRIRNNQEKILFYLKKTDNINIKRTE